MSVSENYSEDRVAALVREEIQVFHQAAVVRFEKAQVDESQEAKRIEMEMQSQGVGSTSVSHSRIGDSAWFLVVGCNDGRIGVDLESASRVVHPKVYSRIVTERESLFRLGALEYWVIKEAAFKSNPFNSGTFVTGYQILSWDADLRGGEVRLPPGAGSDLVCRYRLIRTSSWLIGLAYTRSR